MKGLRKRIIQLILLCFTIGLCNTLLIAQEPSFQWAKSMGGVSNDYGQTIAVDSEGNVYTTGYFQGTVDFDPGPGSSNLTSNGANDIFVQKLDGDGNFVWAKSMGGVSNDYGQAITVDSEGNVYTTGYFQGTVDFDPGPGSSNLTSNGANDIFVQKLDGDGNFVWAKSMGGVSNDYGQTIAVGAEGNVYITGAFEGTVDFDPGPSSSNLTSNGTNDIFVQKLDGDGNFVWAKSMGGSRYDYGFSIAVDAEGNVYTTGYFQGTVDFDPGPGSSNLTANGANDIFVQKLDGDGNFVWAKSMGRSNSNGGQSIALDPEGNVYTTGYFQGTVDFDPGTSTHHLNANGSIDVFIQKLDGDGNFVWAKSMGGSSNDSGFSIAVDAEGNVYTTGYFSGTVDFDPGGGSSSLSANGYGDIFVQKLDGDGNFVWARSMGGSSDDRGYSIAVDPEGNVYTTGYFQGTVDFDPGTGISNLASIGGVDVFVQKLSQCDSSYSTDVVTAYGSYQWIDGKTYTSSNTTATHTLTNQAGCDSVVTLSLTLLDIELSVDNPAVTEGNSGTGNLRFTVSLSHPAPAGGATVQYATSDGSATAGNDYTPISGTLSFAVGESSKTVELVIFGDEIVEANETVYLTLSNPTGTNVAISGSPGTGTITNDDMAEVTLSDVSGQEDDGVVTVTATLDRAVQGGFIVDVSTIDGTATTSDNDYTALNNHTLAFAGTAGESQTFTVIPTSDSKQEADETLSLRMGNLSGTSLSVAITDQATITILNDDHLPVISPGQVFALGNGIGNGTVIGTVLATDTDAGTSFSNWTILSGNRGDAFAIDPTSGELTLKDINGLDFVTASVYTLTLTVSDGSNTSASQTIEIRDTAAPVPDVASLPEVTGYCEVVASEVTPPTATDNTHGTVTVSSDVSFPITTLGTTIITWSYQDESGNTSSQTQKIVVRASPLAGVTFSDAIYTYDGVVHSLVVEGLSAGASVTYQNNEQTNTGSYMVTASLDPGVASCSSITLTATLTIEKAPQILLFDPIPDKKVGADPVSLYATGGESGLPVTFSVETQPASGVASLTGTTIHIEGPGTVTVTARQEGNENYLPATAVVHVFEIGSSELFLPTLFTPNGDRVNDRLILRGGGNVSSIRFSIFDREGNEVFYSESWEDLSQRGWDGTHKGKEQAQGAYVWVLKGQFTDGSPLKVANKNSGVIRLAR
ncbi:SBBP repeat-containing protein [Rapidithrix thailandica]|uniref:SBBP repeat-containing protein n=1 Tax=Rapidithrix thailandica TaxID=413964 RepID=A0AAW9S4I3_9BACT